MDRKTVRILLLTLFLLGFMVTLVIGGRQAGEGYSIQIVNRLPEDMTIYRRATDERGIARTEQIGILERGETSCFFYLGGNEACEMLFAPRWTVQRIARVELPKDALRVTDRTDGPVLVTLGPDGPEVTALSEGGFARLGWKLPLLYLAVVGWIFTLARYRDRVRL